MSKLKAFADEILKVAKIMISLLDRVENIVVGYKHVLLFPQCLKKASSLESLKVGIVWLRVNPLFCSVYKVSFHFAKIFQKFTKRMSKLSSQKPLSVWGRSTFSPVLTLSQTSPGFHMSAVHVFLKTLWEKEKLLVTSKFLLFPQCFLPVWRTFCHFHHIWNCRLQPLTVWKSLKFFVWERVNSYIHTIVTHPFPLNLTFYKVSIF